MYNFKVELFNQGKFEVVFQSKVSKECFNQVFDVLSAQRDDYCHTSTQTGIQTTHTIGKVLKELEPCKHLEIDDFSFVILTIDTMEIVDFMDDIDKVVDLLTLPIDDFKKSYSYLTEDEIILTMDKLFVAQEVETEEDKKANDEVIENLAYLMRVAENMLIEENDGESTGWNVTSEQLKSAVSGHVQATLNQEQQQDFEDICYSMAC